ncbi:neuroblastoma-amplified sequence-like, partial [Pollicipes pollicipes]|uniref:neuroblastoma-amplified sequence-like n=1 Tax=Pollicipes pollicipes TaxID=41117 RepID=UPI001884FC2A
GGDGRLLAVLQEERLEVRSARDNFTSIVGDGAVLADPRPQWRRLRWSGGRPLLAVAASSGCVDVYDALAASVCVIYPAEFGRQPEPRWDALLLVLLYSGHITAYHVSAADGYEEAFNCRLKLYPRGITSATYDEQGQLLVVAGESGQVGCERLQGLGSCEGITCWRLLAGYPHLQVCQSVQEEEVQPSLSWLPWRRGPSAWDPVVALSLCPASRRLLSAHLSGALTVWEFPSLRKQTHWPLEAQPGHDAVSPELLQLPTGRRQQRLRTLGAAAGRPAAVAWWSESALILARRNGAVTVSDAETLANLLGESPEFFSGAPRVTESGRQPSDDEQADDEGDEQEESVALPRRVLEGVRSGLYWLTDSERFEAARRRPRLTRTLYRLTCLRSTTPQQLYARKIELGEYGEALMLAEAYGLDSDLVFLRQWQKSDVSADTIRDYLGRIRRRALVLTECVSRVPARLEAARLLLEHGLRGTGLEAMRAAAQPACDAFLPRLLGYQERLRTYERMLGGAEKAEECYDAAVYSRFRDRTALEAALDFARRSDWQALGVMLTYHGHELLEHRLLLLSNVPETTPPALYAPLLPEVDSRGRVLSYETLRWQEPDWVDSLLLDDGSPLHRSCPAECPPYAVTRRDPTPAQLSAWYAGRAREIVARTCLVGHGLELVQLGRERNVSDLEPLRDDLDTLATLVYEAGHLEVTLDSYAKMAPARVIELMMAGASEATFVAQVRGRLLPYLARREVAEPGSSAGLLHDYVLRLVSNPAQLTALALDAVYACPKRESAAARRPGPPAALDWRRLLDDMLEMQQKVFQVVTPQTVHEIFVLSLLTSARPALLELAGSLMCTDPTERPAVTNVYLRKVSFARSAALVCTAAREYFDAAASLVDPSMQLARQCLQLIREPPEEVRRELGLVDSLELLVAFGVSLLPVQVRLTPDKLTLLERCLDGRPDAYRSDQDLLTLSRLLHVPDGWRLLRLIAERALKAADPAAASRACRHLVVGEHTSAWDVCQRVAECDDYADIDDRLELLSFSLAHCPAARLEEVLRLRQRLLAARLCRRLQLLVAEHSAAENGQDASAEDAAAGQASPETSLSEENAEDGEEGAVSPGGGDGSRAGSSAGDAASRGASPGTRSPGDGEASRDTSPAGKEVLAEAPSERESSPALALLRSTRGFTDHLVRATASTTRAVLQATSDTTRALVSAQLPAELLTSAGSATRSLLRSTVSRLTPGQRAAAAVELAPANADVTRVGVPAFTASLLPGCHESTLYADYRSFALALRLAAYCCALRLAAELDGRPSDATLERPEQLIADGLQCQAPAAAGLRALLEQLCARLEDARQAHQLQRLDRGVDVARFAAEPAYQRDTILGLAMSDDDAALEAAARLARRYGVSAPELARAQLVHLFSAAELSADEVRERVRRRQLMAPALEEPELLACALAERRLEAEHARLERLEPADFRRCSARLLFSDAALKLDLEARQEMAGSLREMTEDRKPEEAWAEVRESLDGWLEHLEYLEWDSYTELLESSDDDVYRFARLFDQTRGEPARLRELRSRMVVDGCHLSALRRILSVFPLDEVAPLETVLLDALGEAVERLCSQREAADMRPLAAVTAQLRRYIDEGGEGLTADQVVAEFRRLCDDSQVDTGRRVKAARLLVKHFAVDRDLFPDLVHADTIAALPGTPLSAAAAKHAASKVFSKWLQ